MNPAILKEKKRIEIQSSYEPFKSSSVFCIKRGDFKTSKIKKMAMEVMGVEVIGNCYQVKLQVYFGLKVF